MRPGTGLETRCGARFQTVSKGGQNRNRGWEGKIKGLRMLVILLKLFVNQVNLLAFHELP